MTDGKSLFVTAFILGFGRMNTGEQILDPVRNLSCYTYDYEDYVMCTWSLIPGSHPEYNITGYIINKYMEDILEPTKITCTEMSKFSCKMDMVDLGLSARNHYLNICIIRCYKIDYTKQVKLSPVYDVEASTNSSCVGLKWQQGSPEFYGKHIYRIRIYSQWDQVSTKTVHPHRESIEVCDLTPHTKYKIFISVKPTVNGIWSDERNISVRTYSDVPYYPPKTCRNCFTAVKSGDTFVLQIYWKDLPRRKWNDVSLFYCIELISYNFSSGNYTESKYTEGATIRSPYVNYIPLLPLKIRIWSKNSRGLSSYYSELNVPIQSQILTSPKVLGVMDNENLQLNITWEGDSKNASYTVFWCVKNATKYCQDRIKWKKSTHANWTLVGVIPHMSGYKFAVAKQIGSAVSGLDWSECIITKEGMPFPPEVEVEAANQTVKISWHYPGCSSALLHNYIQEFVILFCFTKQCTDINEIRVDSIKNDFTMNLESDFNTVCVSVVPFIDGHYGQRSHQRCTNRQTDFVIIVKEKETLITVSMVAVVLLCLVFVILTAILIYRQFSKFLHHGLEISPPTIKTEVDK